MDSKKPTNKIREIVRLQQIIKKWKKLATKPMNNANTSNKSIKFLKKTLSFSDHSCWNQNDVVAFPKGFLAVCVGRSDDDEVKRFIIPTEYLGHQEFGILLREAEEEFGFQNEGVLRIPCEAGVFKKILKMVQEKRDVFYLHDSDELVSSPNCDHHINLLSHQPQIFR